MYECGSFLTPSGKWIPEYRTDACREIARMRDVVDAASVWHDGMPDHEPDATAWNNATCAALDAAVVAYREAMSRA